MKRFLSALVLLTAPTLLVAAETSTPPPAAPSPAQAYQAFVAQMSTPENLADSIARMDEMIDQGESSSAWVRADTRSGLHFDFCYTPSDMAVLYYIVISRKGGEAPLEYADAAKMAALFCDRAGLPHPVELTEGEKPAFAGRWLIKPSEWKAMKKKMLQVRAENRSEKNPTKAFEAALVRELKARGVAVPGR